MRGSPERILITADAVGGVWQFCVDLAGGLAKRGVEVLVACLGPAPLAEQKQQIAALAGVTLVDKPYALEWMPGAGEDIRRSGEWLIELAGQFRPDVVHLNGYAHAALSWRVPALVTAHSCVASWWRAVHNEAPGNDWTAYMSAVAAGLANASVVVAPTAAMARALASEHPLDAAKLRVVPNFSSVPISEKPVKEPLCLAAGRIWDKAKNLKLLDGIAPKLDWRVDVAGSAQSPENEIVDAPHLTLLGEMPHRALIRRMRAASIFAHPALYEPFGLSVLEAARSQCCLVLAAIPSLQELWSACAQFADPHDPDQWVFELNSLMRDHTAREKLAARAAERSRRYSEDVTVNGYLDCYRLKHAEEAAA